MYSQHNLGPDVYAGNGYVYDFFKILWCLSPRRLFVCVVTGRQRREELKSSLRRVAWSSRGFIGGDNLVTVILAAGRKHQRESIVGVWQASKDVFQWADAFPAPSASAP